ncbi:hypothetical protein BS50DRAFT_592237 [Corynespora cassiicola Philippines]|uniref:Uncharacterized protein n=1 Tax=Corynespora cassiicola Philippines TaxID=1448308 RepID=A0A2T2N9S7_CORCC|nr:hypothetical protein BS50DRAFT_592237 [Corynespora cassiicola Philippines]
MSTAQEQLAALPESIEEIRQGFKALFENIVKWAEDLEESCIQENPWAETHNAFNIRHGLEYKLLLSKDHRRKTNTDDLRETPDDTAFDFQCWNNMDDRPLNIRLSKFLWDRIYSQIFSFSNNITVSCDDSTCDEIQYELDSGQNRLSSVDSLLRFKITAGGLEMKKMKGLLECLRPRGDFFIPFDHAKEHFEELGEKVINPALKLKGLLKENRPRCVFIHSDVVAWQPVTRQDFETFDFKEVGFLENVEYSQPRVFFGRLFSGVSYMNDEGEYVVLVKPQVLAIQDASRIQVLEYLEMHG